MASPGETFATGNLAQFTKPAGVASDTAGNIYAQDLINITSITSSGAVKYLTGSGVDSASTNPGIGLKPAGITVDTAGNIFATEGWINGINFLSAGGTLSSIVNSNTATNLQVGLAQFAGVAVDASGNVYLADPFSCVVWQYQKIGTVYLANYWAGVGLSFVVNRQGLMVCGYVDANGTNAQFNAPAGLAIDNAGNLYVADTGNNVVRKITPARDVTTLAGTAGTAGSTDGNGTAALFNGPQGIALDSAGNIYVADTLNGTIRKLTPAGDVTTVAGVPGSRGVLFGSLPGSLNKPVAVTVVPGTGPGVQLVVADQAENAFVLITLP